MREKASTLIEMITVLIITIIILTIALVSFRLAASRDLDTDSRNMLADLQLARAMAVTGHSNYIVSFDIANDSYSIYNGSIATANLVKTQKLSVDLANVTRWDGTGSYSSVTFSPPWGSANNRMRINLEDLAKHVTLNVTDQTGFARLE